MTNDGASRARHPIRVVAERTGLSPDVLRVWERRYGVVEPERGPGGERLYTAADVERLRLLHRATLGGRSIGRVARLPHDALVEMVREDEEARRLAPGLATEAPGTAAGEMVERAVALALALDGAELEALLHRALAAAGLTTFLESVATPLLHRLGDAWHLGRATAAQEHLASAAVRRVLAWAGGSLVPPAGAPGLVVATPAGERHEIGALVAAAAAAVEGWRVTYLGVDLPAGEIAKAAEATGARAVGVSVVYVERPDRLLEELRALRLALPAAVPLLAGGAGAVSFAAELEAMGIHVARDLAELSAALRRTATP